MEGVAELRAKLAAEEERHEDTRAELRRLQEEGRDQRERIFALERTVSQLLTRINDLEQQLAQQQKHYNEQLGALKKRHSEQLNDLGSVELAAVRKSRENDDRLALEKELDALEKELNARAEKNRAMQQRHRNAFVVGQLATVFVERLVLKFFAGDWKKHRRSVGNLDELRQALGDASALDDYLAQHASDLDEEDICNVLYDVKARRDPAGYGFCREPDHFAEECDCASPTPDELLTVIKEVIPTGSERTIMSRIVAMNDGLMRELKHRCVLQAI